MVIVFVSFPFSIPGSCPAGYRICTRSRCSMHQARKSKAEIRMLLRAEERFPKNGSVAFYGAAVLFEAFCRRRGSWVAFPVKLSLIHI